MLIYLPFIYQPNLSSGFHKGKLNSFVEYFAPMAEAVFISDLKTCSKCGEDKPNDLKHFPKDSRTDRPRSPCKACALLQTNAWRNKNKDRVNAQARQRSKRDKCRAQLRERMKRYRRRHPDKKRAESRLYHQRKRQRQLIQTNEPLPAIKQASMTL